MNSKYYILLLLGAFITLEKSPGQTISEEDLHQQIFGKKSSTQETDLPLISSGSAWGQVRVRLQDEQLLSLEKNSLLNAIQDKVDPTVYLRISDINSQWVTPNEINIPTNYVPEDLTISFNVPLNELATRERELREISEKKHLAINPAPLGGAITFRGEQFWADESIGTNYFLGNFDSFLNVHGFVLENQTVYQSNVEERWFRGDTRIVKDFNKSMIRTQVGDVNYQTIGFQTMRPVGGVSIARNFSLNPYRTPYPRFNQEFIVKTRSRVSYFVNGSLTKAEYLAPGRYTIRDLPLVSGINTIVVEIEDDLGRKEVLNFQQTTSINLLNEGEAKFDLSAGKPFQDINFKREYSDKDILTSGFFQYGLSSTFTSAAYAQNYGTFNLLGLETILATSIGNFSLSGALGKDENYEGNVLGVGYNLVTMSGSSRGAHHLNLRYEIRNADFIQTWDSTPQQIKNLYSLHYSLPLSSKYTMGIGGNYGEKNEYAKTNSYGMDLSLSGRFFNNVTASFYGARNRSEFGTDSTLAYLLMTISFPDKYQYLTAYADIENRSQRLTYNKDNGNRINAFRGQASVENAEDYFTGDADILYNSKLADYGVHATGFKYGNGETKGRYSARIHSSLVFAHNMDEGSWALTRPVTNSFALLASNDYLEDQKFSVRSTSPYSEGISDFLGRTVFVNLLPYQFREIQLDPGSLDIGYSLGQENFVLFPTYKSAHFLSIGAPGSVTVRGELASLGVKEDLKTGEIIGEEMRTLFFTNRKGQFLIENLIPGEYIIKLNDGREVPFSIPDKTKGLLDIGTLEVSPWEE